MICKRGIQKKKKTRKRKEKKTRKKVGGQSMANKEETANLFIKLVIKC